MTQYQSSYFSKKIVLLNVVATILIVILHAETPIRWGRELNMEQFPFIWSVFIVTQVAVPLFFFLSGLLFYKDCEWRDLPRKLYKRIFSLVVPFLIWNLFFVTVFWAISKFPIIADKMNAPAELHTAKDWILAIWHTKYTPLWFIKYLIIFNLMSPVILLVIKNKHIGVIIVLGLLAASTILNWDSYCNILYWMPVYLSGALLGRHIYSRGSHQESSLFTECCSRSKIVMTICLAAILIVAYFVTLFNESFIRYYRFIAPIVIWLLTDCILRRDFKDTFVVRDWMRYSFFIYATHHFLLNAEQALIRALCPGTTAVINIAFIVTPVITFILIVCVAKWLSRYKFYKYLTGGR